MTSLPKLHARQQRGAWVASIVEGSQSIGVPTTDPRIAVVMDDRPGIVDWATGKYSFPASLDGDWWHRGKHRSWRDLMKSGRPVLFRKGMDWSTRSAGPKIGFYEIRNLQMTSQVLSFDIVAKVAEPLK
jgi:hypothetical protein